MNVYVIRLQDYEDSWIDSVWSTTAAATARHAIRLAEEEKRGKRGRQRYNIIMEMHELDPKT